MHIADLFFALMVLSVAVAGAAKGIHLGWKHLYPRRIPRGWYMIHRLVNKFR